MYSCGCVSMCKHGVTHLRFWGFLGLRMYAYDFWVKNELLSFVVWILSVYVPASGSVALCRHWPLTVHLPSISITFL